MIISIPFKVVFTTNTKYYDIDTNWTPFFMYETLQDNIKRDFNIENFELVDAIPLTNYFGIFEYKPKLELFDDN